MITLASYRSLMAAELARARLAAGGIQAAVADAAFYTLGYGALLGGVRLQVPAADAERAKEILAAAGMADLPDAEADLAGAPERNAASRDPCPESAVLLAPGRSGSLLTGVLFLAGLACLVLGRPAVGWRPARAFSGQLILLGELLLAAGLWKTYGRLCAAEDRQASAECKTQDGECRTTREQEAEEP